MSFLCLSSLYWFTLVSYSTLLSIHFTTKNTVCRRFLSRIYSILWLYCQNMRTSWNGNIFHVTGLCAGNSPVTAVFPAQRPMMRNFNIFFDRHLNKRFSKQSSRRWFETPSRSLWSPCNESLFTAWFIPKLCAIYNYIHVLSDMAFN